MFERSIYTDVRAEESIDGADGFNFQSISPGIDGTHRRVIVADGLHRISPQFDTARDATDHPPSCIYLYEGGVHYFSRGRSTGTTYSGRRGNSLTETWVATSMDDLIPYVPAQILLDSRFSVAKAAGTHCEAYPSPAVIDEHLNLENLIDQARRDAWLWQLMPGFLTALEETLAATQRKKLVIHAASIEQFLSLVALGTGLFAPKQAARMEIRGLVDNPLTVRGHIMGTHPDIAVEVPEGACHRIDLVNRSSELPAPSLLARQSIQWVDNLDFYDALDTITIARSWEEALTPEQATRIAYLIALKPDEETYTHADWELGLHVVTTLGQHGLAQDVDDYFDELCDVIDSYQLSTAHDFARAGQAVRASLSGGSTEVGTAVLLSSLEKLAAHRQHLGVFLDNLQGSGTFTWPAAVEPAQVESLIDEFVHNCADQDLLKMLRLAASAAPLLNGPRMRPAVNRATQLVFHNPRLLAEAQQCYGADIILKQLRQQLVKKLRAGDPTLEKHLVAGSWDGLKPQAATTADEHDVTVALATATIANLEEAKARKELEKSPPAHGDFWRIVFATRRRSPELYVAWLKHVPGNDGFRNHVVALLQEETRKPPTKELKKYRDLADLLASSYPNNRAVTSAVNNYRHRLDEIDTLGKKTSRLLQGLTNRKPD